MRAPFVASLIRTGHLDNPVWRAIRYALHKWVRGISPLNRALDLLQGEGYTRMMAVAIATEFDKQCRNRTQFVSKTDDSPIYEIPNTQSQVQPGHRYPVSNMQPTQFGMRFSAAASEGQGNGLHVMPLPQSTMPDVRRDVEQGTVSDDSGGNGTGTGTLGSTVTGIIESTEGE